MSIVPKLRRSLDSLGCAAASPSDLSPPGRGFNSRLPDRLLDYGYAAFETHRLYARGEPIAEARVFKGERETLAIGPAEDVYVTVRRGDYEQLEASAELTADVVAPLAVDAVVGRLEISLGGNPLSVLPLIALEAADQGWLLSRLADGMALWLD
jgi:D-alanyl-D-alanine carboxypeptidase (penicillin-binding protein 5/6)